MIERNASSVGSATPTGRISTFKGKTFNDKALARLIRTYSNRIWDPPGEHAA